MLNLGFSSEGLKLKSEIPSLDITDEQKHIFMEQIKGLKDPKDDLKRQDIQFKEH